MGESALNQSNLKNLPDLLLRFLLLSERIGPLPGVKELYFGDVAAGGVGLQSISIAGQDLANGRKRKSSKPSLRHTKLFDISDTYSGGKREMKIRLKPNGRSLGLTQSDLGRQVTGVLWRRNSTHTRER